MHKPDSSAAAKLPFLAHSRLFTYIRLFCVKTDATINHFLPLAILIGS
ncbi:Uncharacterised protein [Citrobacter koseri]|nr:Uncharacterised protein [Citrobacter koseri]